MEQQPTPIIELIELMILMGSIVYLLGTVYQIWILHKNKCSFIKSVTILLLTRLLTITLSLVFWHLWNFPFDIMFLFLFLPAVLPELILSPLILKIFEIDVWEKSQCTTSVKRK